MVETLKKSNLGALKAGDRVNLERALRLSDRLGGTWSAAILTEVGTDHQAGERDIATLMTIRAPAEVMRYIIRKGSVAIDGVSLTVVDFNPETFQVSPHPPYRPHCYHAGF